MNHAMLKSVLVLALITVVAGCATTGGMSPEEAVAQQIEVFKKGLLAQDIDMVLTVYSEDFEHYEWGDKAGAGDFLNDAVAMGYLDDAEVYTEEMEIKVEGDQASAYPIDVSGAFGTATLELIFTKEAGGWLITGQDMSGV